MLEYYYNNMAVSTSVHSTELGALLRNNNKYRIETAEEKLLRNLAESIESPIRNTRTRKELNVFNSNNTNNWTHPVERTEPHLIPKLMTI
jgi:hypothetical protein